MNWSPVQNQISVPGQRTASVTMPQTVAAGKLLVAAVTTADNSGTPPTFGDSASNSWTLAGHWFAPADGGFGSGATEWIYYLIAPTDLASLTVTASLTAGYTFGWSAQVGLAVDEFDLGPNSSFAGVLGTSFNQAGGTSPFCGPITWTPGVNALVYAAVMPLDFNANSVASTNSPAFTQDNFVDQAGEGTPGLATFHLANDTTGTTTPSFLQGGGNYWGVASVVFGEYSTVNQFTVTGPAIGVAGVACGPFRVILGAPAPSGGVTFSVSSSVVGDTIGGTLTIPQGAAEGIFSVEATPSTPGNRTITVTISGYANTGSPLTYDAVAQATGSLHATGQCALAHTSGPNVGSFGGQTAAAIGLRLNLVSATGPSSVTIATWQSGTGTAMLVCNPTTSPPTVAFSLSDATPTVWSFSFPVLPGVHYHLLATTSGFYLNGALYSSCPFGGVATDGYSGFTFGADGGSGQAVNVEISDVSLWQYSPTSTEAVNLATGSITPSQTSTPAFAWWSLGGSNGSTPSIGDAGFVDLAGNGNGLSVATGSLSNATYGPVLTMTDPVVPSGTCIIKSGTFVQFGACANIAGLPIAPITSITSAPTVRDSSARACSFVGGPVYSQNDSAVALFRVGFGQVRTLVPKDGGAGYGSSVTLTWNGDGGGTTLTFPTLTIGSGLESGITGYVVEDGGSWSQTPVAFTGTTIAGSAQIAVSSTSGLSAGQQISGAGIPVGTKILQVGFGAINVSAVATATASGVSISAVTPPGVWVPPTNDFGVATGGSPAYAVATMSGTAITSVSPAAGGHLGCGRHYTQDQVGTLSIGCGFGAAFGFTLNGSGQFTAITIANGGTNYATGGVQLNIWDPTGGTATVTLTITETDGQRHIGYISAVGSLPSGTGFTAPCFTVVPSGNTTRVRAVVSNYISYAIPTASSHDFTSPPTVTISGGSPTRAATLVAQMQVVAGDTYTYDAPAAWWAPTYGSQVLGGIRAVSGVSLHNSTGSLEPQIGGMGTFAQTPTMAAGVNSGSYPVNPTYDASTGMNLCRFASSWVYLHGGFSPDNGNTPLALDPDGYPSSWSGVSNVTGLCRTLILPFGQNNLDPLDCIGPTGQYTLVYRDNNVNKSSANWLQLLAFAATCTPMNIGGPNDGTTTAVTVPSANVTVSSGFVTGVSLSGVTLGTGWGVCIAIVRDTGSGAGAVVLIPVVAGVPSGPIVLNSGQNYGSGTTTVDLYSAGLSGNEVTSIWDVQWIGGGDPWFVKLFLGYVNASGTWTIPTVNGHPGYAVAPPDPVTRLAVTPDLTKPLAAGPFLKAALTGPGGARAGAIRAMDGSMAAPDWHRIWPWEITDPTADDWARVPNNGGTFAFACAARPYNTDPAKGSVASGGDGTYNWPASTKIYGGSPIFTNAETPFTITGAVLAAGSTTVSGLTNPAVIVGSTVSVVGDTGHAYLPATDQDGNPICIAWIQDGATGFQLSVPATQSGTVSLTVTPPNSLTITPGDNGLFMMSGGAPWGNGVIEFRFPVAHGQSSRKAQINAQSTDVPLTLTNCPVNGFLPTGSNGGIAFVTGPFTLAVPVFLGGITTAASGPPQTVAGTAEVDLTAGGTKNGWVSFVDFTGNAGAPYEYFAASCSELGIASWVNIVPMASTMLVRAVGGRYARSGATNIRCLIETGNEMWSGGDYVAFPDVIANLLASTTSFPNDTTVLGYYTANGSYPSFLFGQHSAGSFALLTAGLSDLFKAGYVAAGGSGGNVVPVYGSWWGGGEGLTGAIAQAQAAWALPVGMTAVGPYMDLPLDPTVVAAVQPFGSAADAGGWPVDAMNDAYRTLNAYRDYNDSLFRGHYANRGNNELVAYEAAMEWGSPNAGYPMPWSGPFCAQLQHDTDAHPSARERTSGLYYICQQGGLSLANYFSNINSSTYGGADWRLTSGLGQPPGDGLGTAYGASGSSSWPGGANKFATVYGGLPSDGRAHDGGLPVGNTSPALLGLRDFFTGSSGTGRMSPQESRDTGSIAATASRPPVVLHATEGHDGGTLHGSIGFAAVMGATERHDRGALVSGSHLEYATTNPEDCSFAVLKRPDPTIPNTNPKAATRVGDPWSPGVPLMVITVQAGYDHQSPIQCRADDGSLSAFSVADTLSGEIWQQGQTSGAIATPSVAWYTADSTQNGYDQGQILPDFSSSATASLQGNLRYQFRAIRTMGSGAREVIAEATIVVETAGIF